MVSELPSSLEGSSDSDVPAPLNTYTEKFKELFPQYLAIGMTYEQYWEDDCQLVRAYRAAEEIRMTKKNNEMWLQGSYIYEALCRVSPILHAFAKKGTKPVPYLSEPYSITEKQQEIKEEQNAKKVSDKGKMLMNSLMKQTKSLKKE